MNFESLRSLQKRIREATGPDLDLDWEIWRALCQPTEWWGQKIESVFRDGDTTHTSSWGCNTADGYRHLGCGYIGRYTLDPDGLGPCVALQRIVLPGWCWTVGTCCVSDDAWTAPDWNSPEHGERLRKQYGEPVFGTVFDEGVDIDRRPPGNVCLAFLDAIFSALIAQEEAKERVG